MTEHALGADEHRVGATVDAEGAEVFETAWDEPVGGALRAVPL
jgi:hypothetical protein